MTKTKKDRKKDKALIDPWCFDEVKTTFRYPISDSIAKMLCEASFDNDKVIASHLRRQYVFNKHAPEWLKWSFSEDAELVLTFGQWYLVTTDPDDINTLKRSDFQVLLKVGL